MSSRLAVLAGLLSGVLVAALVLGGLYAFTPGTPEVDATPSPAPSATTAVVSAAPSATAIASAVTSPAPSASPVASASAVIPGVTATP